MSSRISRSLSAIRDSGRKALVPFITAGDPDPAWTVSIMHALVDSGADLIELGVPFSDPMADGPVIQVASERAIEKGVNLQTVLDIVSEFRQKDSDTPVVLMGYMNPVERFGASALAHSAVRAGVDGLLLVDCPPQEAPELHAELNAADIDVILLVAPTTQPDRLDMICSKARGFIYYVAFKGITGADRLEAGSLGAPLATIRERSELPVATGFGIIDAETACAVAEYSDAVVIGSALVGQLAATQSAEEASRVAGQFVASVRQALDNSYPR